MFFSVWTEFYQRKNINHNQKTQKIEIAKSASETGIQKIEIAKSASETGIQTFE